MKTTNDETTKQCQNLYAAIREAVDRLGEKQRMLSRPEVAAEVLAWAASASEHDAVEVRRAVDRLFDVADEHKEPLDSVAWYRDFLRVGAAHLGERHG